MSLGCCEAPTPAFFAQIIDLAILQADGIFTGPFEAVTGNVCGVGYYRGYTQEFFRGPFEAPANSLYGTRTIRMTCPGIASNTYEGEDVQGEPTGWGHWLGTGGSFYDHTGLISVSATSLDLRGYVGSPTAESRRARITLIEPFDPFALWWDPLLAAQPPPSLDTNNVGGRSSVMHWKQVSCEIDDGRTSGLWSLPRICFGGQVPGAHAFDYVDQRAGDQGGVITQDTEGNFTGRFHTPRSLRLYRARGRGLVQSTQPYYERTIDHLGLAPDGCTERSNSCGQAACVQQQPVGQGNIRIVTVTSINTGAKFFSQTPC
jgi:hypothetical protein